MQEDLWPKYFENVWKATVYGILQTCLIYWLPTSFLNLLNTKGNNGRHSPAFSSKREINTGLKKGI